MACSPSTEVKEEAARAESGWTPCHTTAAKIRRNRIATLVLTAPILSPKLRLRQSAIFRFLSLVFFSFIIFRVMRILLCFLIAGTAIAADNHPIVRPAGAAFKVADLEKARQFYSGLMGLDEAFDLRDSAGAVTSIFFKVNDEQYLEFSPGVAEGFQLQSWPTAIFTFQCMTRTGMRSISFSTCRGRKSRRIAATRWARGASAIVFNI